MMFFVLIRQSRPNQYGNRDKFIINSQHDTHIKAIEHRNKINSLYGDNKAPYMIIVKGSVTNGEYDLPGMTFDNMGVEL